MCLPSRTFGLIDVGAVPRGDLSPEGGGPAFRSPRGRATSMAEAACKGQLRIRILELLPASSLSLPPFHFLLGLPLLVVKARRLFSMRSTGFSIVIVLLSWVAGVSAAPNGFGRQETPTAVNRRSSSLGALDTNAKRLAAGLPPLPARKLWSPTSSKSNILSYLGWRNSRSDYMIP